MTRHMCAQLMLNAGVRNNYSKYNNYNNSGSLSCPRRRSGICGAPCSRLLMQSLWFMTHWDRPGLPGLSILLVLFSIFGLLSMMLGGIRFLLICVLGGASMEVLWLIFVVRISSLILLMFVSVIRCFYVVSWLAVFGMASCLARFVVRSFFVAFVVVLMVMVTCFGSVLIPSSLRFENILSFTIS